MAIGERKPISFKAFTQTEDSGGSKNESYTVVAEDFAKVRQRRGARTLMDKATGLETEYMFSEIRQREDFTPLKTMLIGYNGRDLVITDIILVDKDVPHYYTIIAEESE